MWTLESGCLGHTPAIVGYASLDGLFDHSEPVFSVL